MNKLFIIFFAAVCVSLDAQEMCNIQIERASSTIFSGFKERIYIDGKNILSLGNGQSGTVSIPAGDHTIYAELYTLKTVNTQFTAKAGTTLTVTPYSADNFVVEGGGARAAGNTVVAAAPSTKAVAPAAAPVKVKAAAKKKNSGGVEGTLEAAAEKIEEKITTKQKIAIVYVTAEDKDVADFIANELEFIMVDDGYFLSDRSQLDQIRKEQKFQLSGAVDDRQAVSVGKLSGADVIILGSVTGTGDLRRLRLRALNTQTAQVIVVASEKY